MVGVCNYNAERNKGIEREGEKCYFIKGCPRGPLWGGEICVKFWPREQTLSPEAEGNARVDAWRINRINRKRSQSHWSTMSEQERAGRRLRSSGAGTCLWYTIKIKCILYTCFYNIMAKDGQTQSMYIIQDYHAHLVNEAEDFPCPSKRVTRVNRNWLTCWVQDSHPILDKFHNGKLFWSDQLYPIA